jgi:glycosyl transferase family 87
MARDNPWTRRIAALALGLGLAMSLVITPCWWTIYRDHNPVCSEYKPDFISLYTAAVLVAGDRPALYDLERQRQVQQPIDPSRGSWVLPFFYPPFFALLLAPLAALSFSAAFALMTLVNVALLALALAILMRKLELNGTQKKWMVLATFCNYGVHYALLQAQTSFLALILLALFAAALIDNRYGRAGWWSGMLLFKPPLLAVPGLLLLIKKSWRGISALGLVVVGLGLVSYFTVGSEGLRAYFAVSQRAMAGEAALSIQPERMHNLRGLAYFFAAPAWRDYLWYALSLAAIAVVVLQCRRPLGLEAGAYSSWVNIFIGLILIAPHFHDHDMTLFILPSAFILKLGGDEVRPWAALTLVGAGVLPLINTLAFPHLPPLIPFAGLAYLLSGLRRWAPAT